MTSLMTGPCALDGWTLDESCLDVPADVPAETVEHWRRVAAEYLYAATGRRLGPSCPVTVRPCRRSCWEGFAAGFLNQGQSYLSTGGFIPYMRDGQMYNATLCGCPADGCHCGPELCQIELPGPIFSVLEVNVDGVVVDPATYASLDARYLVRTSDAAEVQPEVDGCWPTCQDMSLPPGRPNTFTVTYTTGIALPAMATAALTALVGHFIRGCNGCGCGAGTAQNLQRLSRQGVQLEFADAQQVLQDGRTGIDVVDWFINSYNPGRLPNAMRVLSPDAPRRPRLWMGY